MEGEQKVTKNQKLHHASFFLLSFSSVGVGVLLQGLVSRCWGSYAIPPSPLLRGGGLPSGAGVISGAWVIKGAGTFQVLKSMSLCWPPLWGPCHVHMAGPQGWAALWGPRVKRCPGMVTLAATNAVAALCSRRSPAPGPRFWGMVTPCAPGSVGEARKYGLAVPFLFGPDGPGSGRMGLCRAPTGSLRFVG